jgi:CDGSH-type Zn-finger protein
MNAETPAIPSAAPIEVSVEYGKTYWWCACGRSKTQPFCDGSHKGTSFTPLKYQAGEAGPKWFCVCKQTATRPFCDGVNHGCAGIVRAAASV